MRTNRHSIRLGVVLALLFAMLVGSPADAATQSRWERTEPGAWLAWSSPAIVDIDGDGSNDVVLGGLNGRVYAYDADGRALAGWAGGSPATGAVTASPAVADLDGDGRVEVVIGVGSFEFPDQQGALNVFNADGTRRCHLPTRSRSEFPFSEGSAVYNAPTLGDVTGDGRLEIVYGSFDHFVRVVDGSCRQLGAYFSNDTIFSSAALHDVDGDGSAEIFIGVDASGNPRTGESINGGYFRALDWRPGYSDPVGHSNIEQLWVRQSIETFQSAAAIGDVNGDGRLEVVTGAGAYWCRVKDQCGDSNKVWAFDIATGADVAGWPKRASRETTFLAAPALGDIDGDGRTDVVIGTNSYDQSRPGDPTDGGSVDVFYGDPAKPRRSWVSSDVEVIASPIISDIDGGGTPEVLVSTASQVYALGPDLQVIEEGIAGTPSANRKSSVAVGKLGGSWAIVSAGWFTADRGGVVQAVTIPDPVSTPWPMFAKNAARLGVDPPALPPSGFFDVPASSIYEPSVRWAVDAGVTNGCTATRFCPSLDVTRAQVATFLWRASGKPASSSPSFSDTPPDAYYETAVRWARDQGITEGCTATRFCPNGTATRAQAVTFLWRLAGSPPAEAKTEFTDVPPGSYYETAVSWAVDTGVTTGTTTTTFSPRATVTRGQTVLFLDRALR